MRKFALFVLVLLFALPVAAQDQATEPDIILVPFSSISMDLQGLRPDTWLVQEHSQGVFIRASDQIDLTAIIVQTQDTSADEFLTSIMTSFDLSSELEVSGTFEGEFLNWNLYEFNRTQNGQQLVVKLALAETEERVYYVLMQTNVRSYDSLYESLFVPTISVTGPIQYYVDPAGTYKVPIPLGWELTVSDDIVQFENADGNVLIMISAVEGDDPIIAAENFLRAINPGFEGTFDPERHNLEQIEDPGRIDELEAVYIIDWVDSTVANEDGFFLQTVSRQYEGVIYMTALIGNLATISNYGPEIALVDNGFMILALEEARNDITVEATEEAAASDE